MLQFYFLSVFLNVTCGLALVLTERPHPQQLLRHLSVVIGDPRVRLTLGILGLVTGVFKFLTPMEGDVPFVGDIVPAVLGFLAGGVLILEIHRGPETPFLESVDQGVDATVPTHGATQRARRRRQIEAVLLRSGRVIGILAIAAGVTHFLFPLELFL